MNLKKAAVNAALTLGVTIFAAGATQAATLTVADPLTSLPCTGTYPSISSAVAAAAPGDSIHVCQGTYDEQVRVQTANLTIIGGYGGGVTSIKPTTVTVNTSSLYSGADITAI